MCIANQLALYSCLKSFTDYISSKNFTLHVMQESEMQNVLEEVTCGRR